jgi:hypothetical protein
MSYVPRMSSIVRFRQPPLSALLHPLGVLALLMIQWHALFRHWIGRQAQWKGRNYGGVPPVEVR